MIVQLMMWVALGQSPAPLPPAEAPAASEGSAARFTAEAVPDGLRLVTHSGSLEQELVHLPLGPVRDVLRHGSTFYVALVAGGVVVLDARQPSAPVVTAHLAEGQPIEKLAHQGEDLLVVLLSSRETLTFNLSDPLHPLDAGLSAPPPAQGVGILARKAQVLAVRDGTVIIDGGSAGGFYPGERIKIRSHRALSPQDDLGAQQGLTPLGTTTAVLVLDRVEANRAITHLGRGDLAAVGDSVEATGETPSDSLVAPHWLPFNWQLSFGLRPFLDTNNQNSHAVGLLGDATVAYYFSSVPLRLEAGLEPAGLVAGGRVQHNPVVAVLDVAFASPFFEIGLGTGFSVLATECAPLTGGCASNVVDPLILQTFRLGALDGLNLIWHSAIASTSDQGFMFRSGRAVANVPLTTRVTLFIDGAGGSGYGFGDLGVRTYVGGLGGPGTFILSGGLGFGIISDGGVRQESETVSGPSFMLGLEMRL